MIEEKKGNLLLGVVDCMLKKRVKKKTNINFISEVTGLSIIEI